MNMKSTLKSIIIFLSAVAIMVLLPLSPTTAYARATSQEERITSEITVRKVEKKIIEESIENAGGKIIPWVGKTAVRA
ncbi:MAG: hypothetical protein COX15_01580, partial [Candidatus Colwellbacteria bacterium CG23_combo_of_CG06-09_8_20_14_all_42_19]